jgi:succinoglycan biosynthesis protein ExoO
VVAVSIIIPCHNAAAYLGDALETVRTQTFNDLECLIIDDCSTDGSAAAAQAFVGRDARFRLIRLERRGGVSTARNRGLAEARGTWIAPLDADDLFLPDRLERLTALGLAHDADLVVDEQIVTDFPARTSGRRAFGFLSGACWFTQEDFFARARLFRLTLPAGYMKPIVRRDFIGGHDAAYDPEVSSGEDFLFYSMLFAARPRCIATAYPGYVYRRRRGSLSHSATHIRGHVALGERVLNTSEHVLSLRARAALAGRKDDLQSVIAALPALAAYHRRDWAGVARAVAKRPGVLATGIRIARSRMLRVVRALARGAWSTVLDVGAWKHDRP